MDPEAFWLKAARRHARRLNFAWVLDVLAPALIITALVAGSGLLLYRKSGSELSTLPLLGLTFAAAILPAALTAWLMARKKFVDPERALTRLDARLSLDTRLTAARQGVGAWPEPRDISTGESWNWKRLGVAPALLVLFLAAALFIPFRETSAAPDPAAEPGALREIETSLEKLAQEELVQKDYLEEMEKRLEELREKNSEDWFSHSSLEATDTLREAHRGGLNDLKRNLEQGEKSLQSLQKHAGEMNREQREQLAAEFNEALRQMQDGAMKPNKELLEKLGGINPEALNRLNPEQLNQLREKMRQMAQGLEEAGGQGEPGEGEGEGDQPGEGEGQGEGEGEGEGEEGPGKGGINRGPGHAPGVLGEEGDQTPLGKLEKVESQDLSDILPGDLLQTEDSLHEVDESKVGPSQGGALQGESEGGDRVWRESLLPEEQRAVKGFFR